LSKDDEAISFFVYNFRSPVAQLVEQWTVNFAAGEIAPKPGEKNVELYFSERFFRRIEFGVIGSFPEKSGLKKQENCWKPLWGNQQPSPERGHTWPSRRKGSETMHLPPKRKAVGDDIVQVR
jgi:hypothetical protein